MNTNRTNIRRELTHRTSQDVARELLKQPELISELLPEDKPRTFLAEPAHEKVQRYTGARSTSDEHEQRNLMIGALRLLGASDREIESACGVTRRSIPLILADLEKTGRVTPLKERLSKLVGDNAEQSAIALRILLDKAQQGQESMELSGMIKAVATSLGITVEKLQLLTGAATEIVETRVAAGRDEIEAWAKQFAIPVEVVASPVDTASAAESPVSAQTPSLPPMRHDDDTGSADRPDGPTDRPPAEGPGGGLPFSPGGAK